MKSFVEVMKDPIKADLVETYEAMKADLKSELTNEFDQRIQMTPRTKPRVSDKVRPTISRDDCNSVQILNDRRFQFRMEYLDDKDCYAEITFPMVVNLSLTVSNFLVSDKYVTQFFKLSFGVSV